MYCGRKLTKLKMLKICQKLFFSANKLFMHIYHMSSISAKYQKDTLKALGGVDFTKVFAISTMVNTLQLKLQSGITLAILTL